MRRLILMLSSDLVVLPIRPTNSCSSFNWSAMFSPISPGAIRNSTSLTLLRTSSRYLRPLSGETDFAPFRIASWRIFFPSVPLSPTAPPIPAIGLTRKPTFCASFGSGNLSESRLWIIGPSGTCDLLSASFLPRSLLVFLGRDVGDVVSLL